MKKCPLGITKRPKDIAQFRIFEQDGITVFIHKSLSLSEGDHRILVDYMFWSNISVYYEGCG
ncbi:MAG: hypothetical protein HPY66_3336 [Firmicutes bacterium]|nr:hypothetical protein [Bacillota bacterium]